MLQSGAFLKTLPVKNLFAIRNCRIYRFLGREDPLEEGMATHSSVLAWRIPWTEEPGGLQSMESQSLRHDWVTNTHTHAPGYPYILMEKESSIFLSLYWSSSPHPTWQPNLWFLYFSASTCCLRVCSAVRPPPWSRTRPSEHFAPKQGIWEMTQFLSRNFKWRFPGEPAWEFSVSQGWRCHNLGLQHSCTISSRACLVVQGR